MKDTELCLLFSDFIPRRKTILSSFRQITYEAIGIKFSILLSNVCAQQVQI